LGVKKDIAAVPTIESLLQENESLKSEIVKLTRLMEQLQAQLKLARFQRFGASSERTSVGDGNIQLDLFSIGQAATAPQPAPTLPEYREIPTHKRRKKRPLQDRLPPGTPIEIVLHELPAQESSCPKCGEPMHIMGRETAHDEWDIIPAKVVVTRHVEATYSCRNCEMNGTETPIIKARAPKPPIKGGNASAAGAAHIACQKFDMGLPLYRQEREFASRGIILTRQTMSNWLIAVCLSWLKPIYNEMKRRLLARDILHSDGTGVRVLYVDGKKKKSKSQFWQYRSGADGLSAIIIHDFQPDKTAKRPREFLKDYKGYLLTDGCESYQHLAASIIVLGCWAHARRYFFKGLLLIAKDNRAGTDEQRGLDYCDRQFDLERQIEQLSPEERRIKRLLLSKPVMDEFFAWVSTIFAPKKSPLGEAVTYAIKQRVYLERFLLDGRLEIHNNRAERAFKPVVIGRKNWLFAKTEIGAQVYAIYYSIIETAKENGLVPVEYLTRVFRGAPNGVPVQDLLPWSGYGQV
jgi:transposase